MEGMFKTLSSGTRRKMLKLLARREMHISGIAKELGISVPVAAKHCKILEKSGLVERKKFGRTHVLKIKLDKLKVESLYEALSVFTEKHNIELPKGANVIDALKQIAGVKVEKVADREFVTSIDGERGYYIYEVDGKLPNVAMDSYVLEKNANISLKKLIPIKRKEITIKIK